VKRTLGAALVVCLMAFASTSCADQSPDSATSATPGDPSDGQTSASTPGTASSPGETSTPTDTATPPEDAHATEDRPRDTAGDQQILEQLTWTDGPDGPDGAPTLVFSPPLGVSGPAVRVIEEGDGEVIAEGDSVSFDYVMVAGDTGEQEFSTYERGTPQVISLIPGTMSETFAEGLIGRRVGAKLIFGTVDTSGNVSSDYLVTMFMAVTIREAHAILSRAEGDPVEPVQGLPTVNLDEDGRPSIDIPDTPPPAELVTQPTIEGTGAKVAEGDTVVLNLAGWVWDGGELFDSTWDSGGARPMDLAIGSTLPGLIYGLAGQRVGSQVLLVIPPNLALGDNPSGVIPAGASLVYVVDILDVQ
jgi:peptidylprolyl isomerase